ncbi:13665_t:CDS:2 [Funneliformis caledonium]|uniref:13665_t:CDS:1 n=1 Tax=Funneliformis caledonium TaxID=1117310 RepID=A0A9N9HAH8_9GLOM|nr:13665_t:CDS:2 [Funneliformis caledonium]
MWPDDLPLSYGLDDRNWSVVMWSDDKKLATVIICYPSNDMFSDIFWVCIQGLVTDDDMLSGR